MNRRGLLFRWILFFGLAAQASLLCAEPLPRTVLALYDGKSVAEPGLSVVHRLAEMPLNHLGLVVRYHDINEPLPSPQSMPDLRGVLVWDALNMEDPLPFIRWAGEVLDAGKRLIVVGGFGEQDPAGASYSRREEAIRHFWEKLGLRGADEWVPFTYRSKVVFRDPRLVDFERKIGGVLPAYERLTVMEGEGYSCLKIRQGGDPATDADLVVITRKGGWVASGYAYFDNEATDTLQWYLNPFEFFRRTLATDNLPKPDTTTLAGRRIFFSHIDGDGWNNFTEIYPYRNKGVLSAEIVKREIIEAYPDLPVTVAPIAGDLDPAWHGSPKSLQVAREIFSLPQVEAGSHTYSHPYDWGFFANADPDKERPFLKLYAKPWDGSGGRSMFVKTGITAEKDDYNDYYDKTGYVTPRAYAVRPFSLELEIEGAVDFINALLPPEKRVVVYQWSGDTNPFPAAIEATRKLGLYNINGGDTRLDRKYPSYAWVSPLGRWVGGQLQIYASNSNENIYTDQWSEQFFGYRHLIRTLKNTETPIRIKPIGVYYHMYSGEKLASLNAVRANLDYARSQPIIPLATSHYAAIAEGFFSTRIEKEAERKWRIENRGALQTVRFDRSVYSAVDFANSQGVVGQYHYQGSLYVTLDKSVPTAIVALREYADSTSEPSSAIPYLVTSSWQIWGVKRGTDSFSFNAQGFGEGRMVWKVPHAGRYRLRISHEGGEAEYRVVDVDNKKELRFVLPVEGHPRMVQVRIDYRQETV